MWKPVDSFSSSVDRGWPPALSAALTFPVTGTPTFCWIFPSINTAINDFFSTNPPQKRTTKPPVSGRRKKLRSNSEKLRQPRRKHKQATGAIRNPKPSATTGKPVVDQLWRAEHYKTLQGTQGEGCQQKQQQQKNQSNALKSLWVPKTPHCCQSVCSLYCKYTQILGEFTSDSSFSPSILANKSTTFVFSPGFASSIKVLPSF